MKVTLTVVQGPHEGKKFEFDDHDTFLVGRATYAHFRLKAKDPFVSRTHCMVEVNPPLCRLMDLRSANGSFVNGERVDEIDLQDGDHIQLGDTRIEVSITGAEPIRSTRQAVRKPVDDAELTEDSQFGGPEGYQLLREIGRGGMGIVYLAVRANDRNPIALKTVEPHGPADQRTLDQFIREASILRGLQHPHIVQFHEFGQSHGLLYFAMEFVRGTSAAELVRTSGPLPVRRATKIVCQLLEALAYTHERGFVHRDVKPANVLLALTPEGDLAKLADFGLARVYQASTISGLTLQGQAGGSLAFTPPEQLLDYRHVKPTADLYSTAATLYTLLTDAFIYDFPDAMSQCVLQVLQDEPVPISRRRNDLPPSLAEIIHRGLSRNPEDRCSSAVELRETLMPFADAEA